MRVAVRRPVPIRVLGVAAAISVAVALLLFQGAVRANAAPAPIPLSSSSCPQDIEEGQDSGCVTELQELLDAHGASLSVDGDFGPDTLAAVKSFQSSHGLSVDGIVGPLTKAALMGEAAGAPSPVAIDSSACPTDIEEGQVSGCVSEVQELLNDHGAGLVTDGDFGPLTLAAVESYQSAHGLSVDGIVGPDTKASLLGAGGAPGAINLDSSACPMDIEEGQISGCVSELQQLLNNHGAGLVVDGDFGPLTLAAVESFQSSHGLSVDGIVGPLTKAALVESTGSVPAPINLQSPACPADIEEGQDSGCVTELQQLLDEDGAGLVVDGDFGSLTLAAVESYQSSHGLSVDGIVGPLTKAALYGQSAPYPWPTDGKGNAAIVAAAKRLVDTTPPIPYVWGGGHGAHPGASTDPDCESDVGSTLACKEPYVSEVGYDCSGFDREVLYLAGYGDVGSGNTSLDQTLGSNVPGWTSTSIGGSIQAGDIIVFSDYGPGGTSTHTGIYVGNGTMAEAPETGENLDFVSVSYRITTGDYVVAVRQMPQPSTPPSQGGVVDNSGAGLSTNYDWARLVLRDGGWPTSANNVTVMTEWMGSENPPSTWWRGNDNPLDNGLGSGGGAGLGSYPNLHTAAYYVALNLTEGTTDYGQIVADLKASAAPGTTAAAIWDSPWAASHYGYGADWYTATAPTVKTPAGVVW
jgi:peptidoglycan hydrolase-like protein with peptidoglycan-binding domain